MVIASGACVTLMAGLRPQSTNRSRQTRRVSDINAVQEVGTVLPQRDRARLFVQHLAFDFHVDDADVVVLSCYNTAQRRQEHVAVVRSRRFSGLHLAERPGLCRSAVPTLSVQPASGGGGVGGSFHSDADLRHWRKPRVLHGFETGWKMRSICSARPASAQSSDRLDEVVRRPELMVSMNLEPGDFQLLSNHTIVHSRSEFEDFEGLLAARKERRVKPLVTSLSA